MLSHLLPQWCRDCELFDCFMTSLLTHLHPTQPRCSNWLCQESLLEKAIVSLCNQHLGHSTWPWSYLNIDLFFKQSYFYSVFSCSFYQEQQSACDASIYFFYSEWFIILKIKIEIKSLCGTVFTFPQHTTSSYVLKVSQTTSSNVLPRIKAIYQLLMKLYREATQ